MDNVHGLDEGRFKRRERDSDERVGELTAKIARDPYQAALRMRELEVTLSLAAASLSEAGDEGTAGVVRDIRDDEEGGWGQ